MKSETLLIAKTTVAAPKKRNSTGRVKRACENCKKAKRCCDDGRPCQRCIRLGMESTCRDAKRKEKPEAPKRPLDSSSLNEQAGRPPKRSNSQETLFAASVSPAGIEFSPVSSPGSSSFMDFSEPKVELHLDENFLDFSSWTDGEISFQELQLDSSPELLFPSEEPTLSIFDNPYSSLLEEVMSFRPDLYSILAGDLGVSPSSQSLNMMEFDYIMEFLRQRRNDFDFLCLSQPNLTVQEFIPGKTGLWLLKEGNIVNWNFPAWDMFGYSPSDLFSLVNSWKNFVHPSEYARMHHTVIKAWNSGFTETEQTFTFLTKVGKVISVRVTLVLVQPQKGQSPRFVLCYFNPMN